MADSPHVHRRDLPPIGDVVVLPVGIIPLLERIAARAASLGMGLYVVGGFVRDLLLGKARVDLDLVVEGDAIRLVRELVALHGGRMDQHAPFGTATWYPDPPLADGPSFIDFATTRIERYAHPAALPTVTVLPEHGALHRDSLRRDFTINTLGIRLAPAPMGVLVDPLGPPFDAPGDLRAGIVRTLHDASFIDDPTRIFRAVRFEQRLAFGIEPHTEQLIRAAASSIGLLSADRQRSEYDLIWDEPSPELCLVRLATLEALDNLLSADEWIVSVMAQLRDELASSVWRTGDLDRGALHWAILACRLPDPAFVGARFRLRRSTADLIGQVKRLYGLFPALDAPLLPSQVVRLLNGLPDSALVAGLAMLTTASIARQHILGYAKKWRNVQPSLSGHDLQAMGIPPGPRVGQLLNRLRDALLDGQITTAAQEHTLARQWIDEDGGGLPDDGD